MKNGNLEKKYKTPVITEETIENIKKYPSLYCGSPIRVRMGLIYTNKDFCRMSDEMLSRGMPSGRETPVLKKFFKKKR